ncbi:MAG: hypothetical protein J6Y97_02985 [Prevotella sp.]|nr:hypothetical protein [Prevotella sp.]
MEIQESLFTTENIAYVVFAILAVIVAFTLIKKIASCLLRTVVFLLMLAALAYIYLNYIDKGEEKADQQKIEYRNPSSKV